MAALLKDWPTGLGLLALTLVTFHFAVAAPAVRQAERFAETQEATYLVVAALQ